MITSWLAYQQWKLFEKLNNKFINLVNNSFISTSTLGFKISVVKFLNKYPKMKRSSLSLQFLKNNFKMIKEIYHEIASDLNSIILVSFFNCFKVVL